MMEQLEIPLDFVEQFAVPTKPLMWAFDRFAETGTVRLAPENFKAPKWDLDVYQYDTYTREKGYHTVTLRLDFMKQARKPWKPPGRKAFPEPTGMQIGAMITFQPKYVGGGDITGQVWSGSPRPNCVWVASGSAYYLVDTRDGIMIEMWDGRML